MALIVGWLGGAVMRRHCRRKGASHEANRPAGPIERVFLVVVDESPEMRNALRYACRRAKRTGGRVAMLYVMDPPEGQQWGAVVDLMRQEARQQAEEIDRPPRRCRRDPHRPAADHPYPRGQEPRRARQADHRGPLDLGPGAGSASSNEGPGPLVTAFAGKLGNQLRIPLTIVPGALSEAEIDAIS